MSTIVKCKIFVDRWKNNLWWNLLSRKILLCCIKNYICDVIIKCTKYNSVSCKNPASPSFLETHDAWLEESDAQRNYLLNPISVTSISIFSMILLPNTVSRSSNTMQHEYLYRDYAQRNCHIVGVRITSAYSCNPICKIWHQTWRK